MSRPIVRTFMVGLLLAIAGCKSDPKSPETWEARAADAHRQHDRVRVWDELRGWSLLDATFLDMLLRQLGSEKKAEVKASIARLLGTLKSPRSVQPLSDAIDLGGTDSETGRMNREIAATLGRIGDPAAVPALQRLMKSKDRYVQVEAITGLGALHAKEAVDS